MYQLVQKHGVLTGTERDVPTGTDRAVPIGTERCVPTGTERACTNWYRAPVYQLVQSARVPIANRQFRSMNNDGVLIILNNIN